MGNIRHVRYFIVFLGRYRNLSIAQSKKCYTGSGKYGMQPVHLLFMQHRILNHHYSEKAYYYNMLYINMREFIRPLGCSVLTIIIVTLFQEGKNT